MGLKKGKLNKVECFYIEHHVDEMTEQELAEELNRSVKVVRSHIEKFKEEQKHSRNTKKTEKAKRKETKLLKNIKESSKNERGAFVLGPHTAQEGDEARKRSAARRKNQLNSQEHIHNPLD